MAELDVAVIGSGPGGYIAAIRAAQLGMSVAIVEKNSSLGGTCMNVGCIPTNALLDSSEIYYRTKHELADHGISTDNVHVQISKMMDRKNRIVKELTDGISFLMKKNKIQVIHGVGSLKGKEGEKFRISIASAADSDQEIITKYVIIATGSVPIELPITPFNGKSIISSDEAIALDRIPESMAILGAGAIGLELGSVYQRLGSKVTIIEMLPEILPYLDRQLRETAKRAFTRSGLTLLANHTLVAARESGNQITLQIKDNGNDNEKEITADTLLIAAGRKPYTARVGLENVGISTDEKGCIPVDPESLETSVKGIFAIGDCIAGAMLAHRAEEEGVAVAERLAGMAGHVNYRTLPSVIYTDPEIATVGLSEEQCLKENRKVKSGKFFIRANGRAKASGKTDGMVKIVADAETDRLLGCAIVGPHASEILGEAVIAMEFDGSAEDLARSFHAHPTLTEAIREAALDVDKRSLNS